MRSNNKYFFWLLFICQIAFSQKELSVLTFNIWDPNDVPFWQPFDGFPTAQIATYVSEDKADVLLLQEVSLENNTEQQAYARLKRILAKKGYLYSAFYRPNYSTGRGDIGYYQGMENSGYPLAILSKYPILETYARQTDQGVKMAKGVLGIKILYDDQPLYLFNTHFSIGVKETDLEMSKVAIPFINEVAGREATVFAGDFNCPSATDTPHQSKTIGKYTYSSSTDQFLLDDGFQDAYRLANPNINFKKDATCPGQDDIIKRVDRIYLRNTSLVPVQAFVKPNPWKKINKVDHCGVFIRFKSK